MKNNNIPKFENISKKHVITISLFALFAVSGVFAVNNNFVTKTQPNALTSVNGVHTKNSLISLSAKGYSETKATSFSNTKRVSLAVTIQNLQQFDLQIAPGLQFFVVDTNANEYPYTAQYLAEGVTIGGPLAHLMTQTYVLDFDVSASATIKKLKFQTDSDSQPVYVRL